jgi:hypothetical protein
LDQIIAKLFRNAFGIKLEDITMSISNMNLNTVVNDKIRSDRNNTISRANLMRLVGLGSMVALSSLGVTVAYLAINYQPNRYEQSQKIAMYIANSLEKTKLQANASGNVELDKNASVTLEKNQIVSVDPRSKLKIDPNSTINIQSDISSGPESPSKQQLGLGTNSNSSVEPKTTYTLFKYSAYEDGLVVTGWVYDPGNTSPKTQYCYFSKSLDDMDQVRIDIAYNGKVLPSLNTVGRNILEAGTYCRWYNGF